MNEAHEKGYPIMRPLFYEFSEDSEAWETDNTYLLGSDILVAPIMNYKDRSRDVYLPANEEWIHLFTKERYQGGQNYTVDAPIDEIPIFIKSTSEDQFKAINHYLTQED